MRTARRDGTGDVGLDPGIRSPAVHTRYVVPARRRNPLPMHVPQLRSGELIRHRVAAPRIDQDLRANLRNIISGDGRDLLRAEGRCSLAPSSTAFSGNQQRIGFSTNMVRRIVTTGRPDHFSACSDAQWALCCGDHSATSPRAIRDAPRRRRSIPRTATEKIRKSELRDHYEPAAQRIGSPSNR